MSLYITIEGPEATGKTTQAELLWEKLKEKYPDRPVILTKEPGSKLDNVCQQIRGVLLDPKNSVCDKSAFLLFLADRAQHIDTVIAPALKKGGIVISDRSSLSTVVYHVAKMLTLKEEESYDYFYEMIDFAQEIQPDLCFVANADFDWCVKRLEERAGLDRIEQFGNQFHKNVHELFHEISTKGIPYSNGAIFGIRERMACFPKKIKRLPDTNKNTEAAIHKFIADYCEGMV